MRAHAELLGLGIGTALVLCLAGCTAMEMGSPTDSEAWEEPSMVSSEDIELDEAELAVGDMADGIDELAEADLSDPLEHTEMDASGEALGCLHYRHTYWQCCGCGVQCEFAYWCTVCDTWGSCDDAVPTGRTRAGNCPPPC
jgi:hypothetical protein